MNNVDELGLDGDGDGDDDDDGDDVDFDVWLSYDGYGGSSWITSYDGSDGGDYGFWWDPGSLGWLSDPTAPSNLGGGGASGRGSDPTGPAGSALMSGNSPSSGFSAAGSSDASGGFVAVENGLNLIGFIPELILFTNTINAGLELTQGHFGMAGAYGAAAAASVFLPGAGAIAKGGEAMVEAAKAEKAAEESVVLYRGVSSAHPGYENAVQGIAEPRGGPASMIDHILGSTDSPYTSWTADYDVAHEFATQNGTSGVIMVNKFTKGSLLRAPGNLQDLMEESEYLIKGRVTGSQVMRVR